MYYLPRNIRWANCHNIFEKMDSSPIYLEKIVNKNLAKIDLITDETALYHHYQIKHKDEIKTIQNQITKAYKVIFIERPPKYKLDTAENFWIFKLNSKINVVKSQLPNYN